MKGPHLLDNLLEELHGDQHSAALCAIEDTEIGDGGVHQRNAANRAGLLGRLIEDAHTVVVLLREIDALAVFALEAGHIRFEAHGSAAGGTVHCGLPHPAQNLAR